MPAHRLQADPFDPTNPLTPKRREAVQDETKRDNGRPNDPAWFEETMAKAFAESAKCFARTRSALWFLLTRQEDWEALPSGTPLRPWQAGARHDNDRQRRLHTRGIAPTLQNGIERIPDWLSTDDKEGSERLARIARRGDGGQEPSQAVSPYCNALRKNRRNLPFNAMHRSHKALDKNCQHGLETNLLWTWLRLRWKLDTHAERPMYRSRYRVRLSDRFHGA